MSTTICDVGWCVAIRKPGSIYCAVHASTPEAFKAKDPEVAKSGMNTHNRKLQKLRDSVASPDDTK